VSGYLPDNIIHSFIHSIITNTFLLMLLEIGTY